MKEQHIIEKNTYWDDLDAHLESLLKVGYVKLPSIDQFDLPNLAKNISSDMGSSTFAELGKSHESFLKNLGVEEVLAPKLFDLAREFFDYKGKLSNQYHIARRVEPGNSKEMYRAHFDSHLFTMVLPIKIPQSIQGDSAGELIYFPQARPAPKGEITNIIGKAYHKRFATKEGIKVFAKRHKQMIEDFRDHCPLIFIGNTTLHTNRMVSQTCSSYRLTLLAHFFDPSPKFGVGGLMRLIRGR